MRTMLTPWRTVWRGLPLCLASAACIPACSLLAPSDADLTSGNAQSAEASDAEDGSSAEDVVADAGSDTARADALGIRDTLGESAACAALGQACGPTVACCSGSCKGNGTCH